MIVRKARLRDVDTIIALGLRNKLIVANARAPSVVRNEIGNYNVLVDRMDNVVGYSKVTTNASGATIDSICIKPNLIGRGLEQELFKPIKKRYNNIKYNGRYKTRLGFVGGEYVVMKEARNIVAMNKEKLKTRTENLDGINYLVAPVVLVREQVLNGELLPAEEIEKSAVGWNGRPVVVYHPQDNEGNDVIANDPEVVPKYEVGKVYNVEYDSKTTKLKGEIWIDVSKAKRKNKDTKLALEMINESDALEVSTGYIVNDRLAKEGEFDGVEYKAIQRDIMPDHLALLPKEIGACSWEDGAGVRNNSARGIIGWFKKLITNINSRGSIMNQVSTKLKEEYDDFSWVSDLIRDNEQKKDFAVFSTREEYDDGELITTSKQYAVEYSFDDEGSVILGDILQEVEPVTQYITKTVQKEEKTLNRKENIVRDVIANSKGKLGRKDKSTLLNCNESALLSMLPAEKRKAYVTNAKKTKKVTANSVVTNLFKDAKFTTNEGEEVMVEELVAMAPEDVASTIDAIDDVNELNNIADVLDEVIAVAGYVESIGSEIAVNEEFAATISEVIASAEEVLAVVEVAIEELGGSTEPADNVDVSDIFDQPEESEDETVGALETASRKMATNKRAKNARTARNAGKEKKTMSVNDYINSIPDPEAREFIKNGVAEAKAHRAKLITTLAAHKACEFSEKELKAMETNQLEKISAMVGGTSHRPATNASFAARGMQEENKAEKLDFIPLTTNIFKKEDK